MNEKEAMDSGPSQASDLRREAERRLRDKNATPAQPMAEVDVRALVHELQVHQIELEMQNEELQRAQAAAEESSNKYAELFDFAPVAYFLWDERGEIVEVNLAGAALLGLDRSVLLHKRFGQFVVPESRLPFHDFCNRVWQADTKQTCEVTLLKAGQTVPVMVEGIVTSDSQGTGKRCRAAVVDISHRKRAEDLLRQSHDELQAIYGGMLDGLLVADVETRRFLKANPAMRRLLGYSEEELLSLSVGDIHPPDALPKVLENFQAQAEGRLHVAENCPVLGKDGTVSYADIGSSRTVFGDRPCVVGFFHDVTERRRAEEAIRDREEELVTIYENAPIIMLLVDAERRVRKVNKYAKQFAGASEAELIGRRGGEALRCVHAPDDPRGCGFGQRCQHCAVRRTVLDTLGDGRSRHQVEASLPFAVDGKARHITFLLSTARLNVRGEPQVLVAIQDITDRKQLEKKMAGLASFPTLNPSPVVEVDLAGQVHFLNPAATRLFPDLQQWGATHPWLADWDSVARAFREDSAQEIVREVTVGEDCYQQMMHYVAEIERVRIYAMDITARKRADEALQRTTAELARSNKDLDQFASVASHDLQEPLRVVTGFVQLLQKKYQNQLDAEADQFIEFAADGAKRMGTLIKDLLAYARVGSRGLELAPTDAGAALRQAVDNLRVSIEETTAEITYGELPTVRADAGQLVQLFQNLLGNALKFHGEEPPKIHVDASRQEDHWLFSVRDNGIGIASEFLDRIFLIFERLHTRTQYPGTGIGLAICKRIVDRHGGRIGVESEPGQGATFSFTLPT
jgi:PAS domain S-box-containing protein